MKAKPKGYMEKEPKGMKADMKEDMAEMKTMKPAMKAAMKGKKGK